MNNHAMEMTFLTMILHWIGIPWCSVARDSHDAAQKLSKREETLMHHGMVVLSGSPGFKENEDMRHPNYNSQEALQQYFQVKIFDFYPKVLGG